MDKFSLDSNILVYAIDTRDRDKHDAARALIRVLATRDTVLTLQSLAEFAHVAGRKGNLSIDEALDRVLDWQKLFPSALANAATLSHAIAGVQRHGLAFWDAMLWATAQESGVTTLFTEDFHDGAIIEGVRFLNPFGLSNLDELVG